jgi:hypothetical protein
MADPIAVPLPKAPAWCGLSRSRIYRLAGEGKIRLIKAGKSTLVDVASVRAYLADAPVATIRKAA